MPAKDPNRWTQNEDGSWSRNYQNVEEGKMSVLNDYSGMTKAELEDELESRGLTKTGNKDELIARLTEDDNT